MRRDVGRCAENGNLNLQPCVFAFERAGILNGLGGVEGMSLEIEGCIIRFVLPRKPTR